VHRQAVDDRAVLDALVRDHRAAALHCARRILGDAHLAEDAVQRAFLQILLRVRGGDSELLAVNPRAVVLQGTRWAALKIAGRGVSRGDAERRAAAEALASTADGADWDRLEARLLVEDILPELPEHYRDVLRLRFLEERPDARAAQDLAVTVKAYRRRLDRALLVARHAAVRIGVTSLGAVLMGLLRRWRQGVAAQPRLASAHLAMLVAVAGMVTGSGGATRGAAPRHPMPLSGVWSLPSHDAVAAGGAALVAADHSVSFVPVATPRARPAGPPSRPAGETLDDMQVVSLIPAPHASQNHTAVAEAYGGRCACHMLLQTTDGGASWSMYPSAGELPMLPPDYPRDPRILFRGDSATFDTTMCIERRISDGACTPLPFSVVAGDAVLDPSFDDGWPLIYATTTAGVVSYDLDTGQVQLLALDNGTTLVSGVPLSTPGGPGPWAVYMLVRGMPVPDATLPREPVTDAAPLVGAMHLVGCPHQGACQSLGEVTGDAYALASDRDDPSGRAMAAYDPSGVITLTPDAGASDVPLTIPGQHLVLSLQLMGVPGQLHISALLMGGSGGHMSLARWEEGSGWTLTPIDAVAPPITVVYQAALGGGRVIVADAMSRGVHCSTDGGATWATTCPPA